MSTHITDTHRRRGLIAISIGNATEWYDFAVYAYLAPQISAAFFPEADAAIGLLSTFAIFAIAFFFRPLGGFIFGPLGDRIGRQRILTAVVLLMALATFVIGIIPGYDMIGILAPMLLILARILQGICAGGEYGGAATYLAETSPPSQRGRYMSWIPSTSYVGLIFASLLIIALRSGIGPDAFNDWGWRIPFLLALPAGLVGVYMRSQLEETPEFEKLKDAGEVSKKPLRETLVKDWRSILRTSGLMILLGLGTYLTMTYLSVYLTAQADLDATAAQWVTTAVLLTAVLTLPIVGRVSDHFGRRPTMLLSAGLLVVGAVPAFMALSTGSLGITLATAVILSAVFVTYQGSALPAMTELFPTARRYSGFSVGYNLSIALFGGTAPYLSTFLIDVTGASIAPGFLLAGAAVLSILTALSAKETAPTPLERRSNRIRVASRQPELDPLAKREGMMGNPAGELR